MQNPSLEVCGSRRTDRRRESDEWTQKPVTLLGVLLFVAVLAAPTFVLAAGLGALSVPVVSTVQDFLGRTTGRRTDSFGSRADSVTQ